MERITPTTTTSRISVRIRDRKRRRNRHLNAGSMDMPKLFTDQQMALILKRAAERQAAGAEPTHSLESIQDIARQVGIDSALVADAAATIERSSGSVSSL